MSSIIVSGSARCNDQHGSGFDFGDLAEQTCMMLTAGDTLKMKKNKNKTSFTSGKYQEQQVGSRSDTINFHRKNPRDMCFKRQDIRA